ncbi:MAG TPA: acyl-CoA dehydrogenase family protein [Phycisphaerae bacterium]|jgi:alkylation response protein AidB-like acyl-CoA dehydrogenase
MSNDEELLIETVRDFARHELLPLDRACDLHEISIAQALPRLAEMGLLNLCLPENVGGLACSLQTYARIIHEVSYASPSAAVTLSVHNMVGDILARHAPEPQRTHWLSRWGEADSLSAFAISEAGAGSDASSARTRAVPVEGGFRIAGEKMWITNGLSARWFLLLVQTDSAGTKTGLTAVVVDGREPGVERTAIKGKMGIRGSETIVLHLSDVFVQQSYQIGAMGEGLKVCLSTLNEGRIGIAAQATGIAEACLDAMIAYARQRTQFGRPIAEFQAIQNMVADSAVELAAARELTRRAAALIDSGRHEPSGSSMAKLYATESAGRIADRAVQVHGGTGYVHECRVEQLYRDVRVTRIYEGTSEIQRLVIARELFGE